MSHTQLTIYIWLYQSLSSEPTSLKVNSFLKWAVERGRVGKGDKTGKICRQGWGALLISRFTRIITEFDNMYI